VRERKGQLPEGLDVYQSLLELLPYVGWPEWPPAEPPPLNKGWFKEEIAIHPQRPHLPKARLIEIIGLPQTGKTTLRERYFPQLRHHLDDKGWQLTVWEEGHYPTPQVLFEIRPPIPPPLGDEGDEDLIFMSHEKHNWLDHLVLQWNKEWWWQGMITNLIDSAIPNRHHLVAGYRGPLDAMIWLYALAAHQEDPAFTVPDWYRPHLEKYGPLVASSHALVGQFLDAAVIIGISQEEAQKRREKDKKPYPGSVTDSPFFDDLSAWYGYWVREIQPRTQTGLLLLNGESSLDHNFERLRDYVDRLTPPLP
jgi:hypothetical protein